MYFYASACVLLTVFALSIGHKVLHYEDFKRALAGYEILPAFAVVHGAWVFVAFELAAVVELLASFGQSRTGVTVLLFVYAAAMAINLARGKSVIDCGCGSAGTPLSGWLVGRNLLFVCFAMPTQPVGIVLVGNGMLLAIMLVVAVTIFVVLCHEMLNQLLANRAEVTLS